MRYYPFPLLRSFFLILPFTPGWLTASRADEPSPPDSWRAAWVQPTAWERPLQIVHRIPRAKASVEGLRFYRNHRLGGIVTNVAFDRYMQSEEHWLTLIAGVEACRELGLRVWLYDEEGYPSGAAGGLVLTANPALEALALVRDSSRLDPFFLRPAYEHTHASNNFHAARRYINLLDERAVAAFIDRTHEAYWRRLKSHFGKTISAFFTDEPSLMAVNIGQLPESIRRKVRIADRLDPQVPPLPSVPWSSGLPEHYRRRYGEDLLARRRSLFEGAGPEERRTRQQFWALVADLTAQNYYGQIQDWCRRHQVASSGHKLHEESLLHHVPLDGNGLKVLCRMDIPGLDMLSSNPEVVLHSGWLTAALPLSAALLEGRRQVMTEVSDFSEKMSGRGPASLGEMQAAAAWQSAWGVTEFTLYYRLEDRPADQYMAYADFVGRLNAVLRKAQPTPEVLLYYPIYDLWSEYRPMAQPLDLAGQTRRAQQIAQSFMRLGQTLQRHQVPFVLIDHEHLPLLSLKEGRLALGGNRFKALVVPQGVEFPGTAAAVVQRLTQGGGHVFCEGQEKPLSPAALIQEIGPAEHLFPPCEHVVLGRFEREGRKIALMVNVGRKGYRGTLRTGWQGTALVLEPDRGLIRAAPNQDGVLSLSLAPHQTLLLVGK